MKHIILAFLYFTCFACFTFANEEVKRTYIVSMHKVQLKIELSGTNQNIDKVLEHLAQIYKNSGVKEPALEKLILHQEKKTKEPQKETSQPKKEVNKKVLSKKVKEKKKEESEDKQEGEDEESEEGEDEESEDEQESEEGEDESEMVWKEADEGEETDWGEEEKEQTKTKPKSKEELKIIKEKLKTKTENAIKMALQWFKRHQNADGSWGNSKCACHRCANWFVAGNTGLALLALNTYDTGSYKKQIEQGVNYLTKLQDKDGCFGARKGFYMYSHAIATLALVDIYSTSKDQRLKLYAQKGIDFLAQTQTPKMAWNHAYPSKFNNTSTTGWCVLALAAAKFAKFKVPQSTFEGALNWVNKVTENYYFRTGYMEKNDSGEPLEKGQNFAPSEAMTAAGITIRMLSGNKKEQSQYVLGGAGLINIAPVKWGKNSAGKSLIDFYYWYFGTLAMSQLKGDYWKSWKDPLANALLNNQQNKNECSKGSWSPVDPWEKMGGRAYSTALCTFSLAVFYKHLDKE